MENNQELTNGCSPIMRYAIHILECIISDIQMGKFSEKDLTDALTKFHPKSNSEYFNPNDFCTYDEALKILGWKYNRNRLNETLKKKGIVSYKFKNRPLGFRKQEIIELSVELREQMS